MSPFPGYNARVFCYFFQNIFSDGVLVKAQRLTLSPLYTIAAQELCDRRRLCGNQSDLIRGTGCSLIKSRPTSSTSMGVKRVKDKKNNSSLAYKRLVHISRLSRRYGLAVRLQTISNLVSHVTGVD